MHTRSLSRRTLLGGAAGIGAGLALPGCSGGLLGSGKSGLDVDKKIMTFALNLEYMEAEYYTRGAYGHSLRDHGTETGRNAGPVRGGRKVEFSKQAHRDHAEELAYNEAAHVAFYRTTLGPAAPDAPEIDFEGGFTGAALAAGLIQPGQSFDPFANEMDFFLGGMLFEDVGVTAYNGAAPLISSKVVLAAAASIMAVEAYHMGMARTLLYHAGADMRRKANAISDARDTLDGSDDLDQGIEVNGKANIVPNDAKGMAFSRTPSQALSITCGKRGATRGGFYPSGMNGDIAALLLL